MGSSHHSMLFVYLDRRKKGSPSAFYFMNCQFSLHSSLTPDSSLIPAFFLFFLFCFVLWEPFDVDVHTAAYACFYFYATGGTGSEGMGAGVMQGGAFGMCVSFWRMLGLEMGGNADGDSHSPLPVTSFLPVNSRWTIWMKMRSTFSGKLRTDSPAAVFVRLTRKGRGRRSSTPWIRTPLESHP